jgi:4-amino-4-deoxy-L-arabinose transferase-like glycosyltransferase
MGDGPGMPAVSHPGWRQCDWRAVGLIALLLAALVAGGTALARPRLIVAVDAPDALHILGGFYPLERNESDAYRWSQAESTLRLFGFEQRGPALVSIRLSAARPPGAPIALLAVAGAGAPVRMAVSPAWRHYQLLVPLPPRGNEAPALVLRSTVQSTPADDRELGVALSRASAQQLALTPGDYLPDAARLLFFVALGLLLYASLRRTGIGLLLACTAVLLFGLVAGTLIASAPAAVAYCLPNLWLPLAFAWSALFIPGLIRVLRRSPPPGLAAAGLVAVALSSALLPFAPPGADIAGWTLLLGGALAILAGLPARGGIDEAPLPHRIGVRILTATTLIALITRLVGLDTLPVGLWRDEARHGLVALRILHDATYRPVYVPGIADLPALLFYMAAVPIGIFGPHPWTIRIVPALAGAFTPAALYFAAKPFVGQRTGLLAAGLLATSSWHIAISRIGFPMAIGVLCTTLAVGALWRSLTGSGRTRLGFALLAGALGGLAVYGYHASRLTPLALVGIGLVALWHNKRAWRCQLPCLGLAAAVGLIVMLPLLRYAILNNNAFNQRIANVSIFNEDSRGGHAPAALVQNNLLAYLRMWHQQGDTNPRHNLPGAPMLDPLSATMLACGVAFGLTRLREPQGQAIMVWLGVMLLPGLFAGNAPHTFRAVETLPPTMALASLGGAALTVWVADAARTTRPVRLRSRLLAGVLFATLLLNSVRYFVLWPQAAGVYDAFYVPETKMGLVAQKLETIAQSRPDYRVYLMPTIDGRDIVQYLLSGTKVILLQQKRDVPAGEQALVIARGTCSKLPDHQGVITGMRILAVGPPDPAHCPMYLIYGHTTAQALVDETMR